MTYGRWKLAAMALVGLATVAGAAAACGGGTSSGDKTATAAARGGATSAASSTAARAASPSAAASAGATAAATGQATSGAGASTTVKIGDTSIGKVLTDVDGKTLYTYKNDAPGKSNVAGGLAQAWPPLTTTASAPPTVAGATGAFTLLTRDDGQKQVAYKGMPLYRFVNDKAPGDTTGNNLGGVWSVATP